MGTPRKYTKEVLEPLVAQTTSVAGVLRLLGLRQNGGAHAHISRTIKRFDIDTSHFVPHGAGGNHQRRSASDILTLRPWGTRRERPTLLKRALVDIGIPYRCALCGVGETWQGAPLTLDVDHIDGDFHDNRRENLRFLCPNGHRQTPNFAGRGKGRFTDERGDLRRDNQGRSPAS
jgi:hypothetical protein